MRRRSNLTIAPNSYFAFAALALVFLWGIYQSFWNLGARDINGDEQTYVQAGWQYVHGRFALNQEHPPTAKYLFGLAQLVVGQGVVGPRAVVAGLIVLGGAVIFWWLRREVGWWGALLATGLWMLGPRGVPDSDGLRIDRSATIDPVMVVFALAAFATGWRWIRTERWYWAAASGVLMAASVTSKVSTLVLLPAFLILPMLFRRWRTMLWGGLVWTGAFAVTAIAVYAPLGFHAVHYMLSFQSQHNQEGHLTSVAGTTYTHAPWWANLWFMVQGMGLPFVIVLAVGVVAALVIRPDRLTVWLAVSLALILGFYLGYADVALAYYYDAWTGLVSVLAGVGYARLATMRPRLVGLPVVAAAVVVALFASAGVAATVWRARPTGIARVPALLRREAPPGGVPLVAGLSPSVYAPYLGSRATMSDAQGPYSAIIDGTDPRFPLTPKERAVLSADRADFRRYRLDDVTLWVPDGLIVETGPASALNVVPRG